MANGIEKNPVTKNFLEKTIKEIQKDLCFGKVMIIIISELDLGGRHIINVINGVEVISSGQLESGEYVVVSSNDLKYNYNWD